MDRQVLEIVALSGRNAALGYGANISFHTLLTIFSARNVGLPAALKAAAGVVPNHTPNAAKWGLFLALAATLFQLQRRLLRRLWARLKAKYGLDDSTTQVLTDGLGGLLAGLCIGLLPKGPRNTLALYGFVRASYYVGALAADKNDLRNSLPWPINRFDAGTVIMSAATCNLAHTMLYYPHMITSGYQRFLFKFGGRPREVFHAFGVAINQNRVEPAAINYMMTVNAPRWHPRFDDEPLEILSHIFRRGRPLVPGTIRFIWWNFWKQCFPLYLPLKVALAVRHLMQDPLKALLRILTSTSLSALFLSLYCGFAIVGLELGWRIGIKRFGSGYIGHTILAVVAGTMAGLATLCEPAKSRRVELGLYTTVQLLPEFYKGILVRELGFPKIRRLEIIIFSLALATFAALTGSSNHGDRVHPYVRRLVKYLLDV